MSPSRAFRISRFAFAFVLGEGGTDSRVADDAHAQYLTAIWNVINFKEGGRLGGAERRFVEVASAESA